MKKLFSATNFLVSQKTKPIIKTLIIFFFVFVYFLVIWLLFGEFNLSNQYYLVYQGMINPNDPNLAAPYGQIGNFALFYYLFLPGIFYVLIVSVLTFFKKTTWDIIPILFSSWLTFVVLIISALLPTPYSILILTLRVVLVLITFVVLFFTLNFIIVKLVTSPNSQKSIDTFMNYASFEINNQKTKTYFKKMFQMNKNLILDVDPKNIFFNKKPK